MTHVRRIAHSSSGNAPARSAHHPFAPRGQYKGPRNLVPAFPQKLQKGFAPLPAGSPLAQNEERLVREFDNNTVMLETNFELLLTALCTIEMEFRLLIKGNIGVIAFSLWPMCYSIASVAASRCPA